MERLGRCAQVKGQGPRPPEAPKAESMSTIIDDGHEEQVMADPAIEVLGIVVGDVPTPWLSLHL